jgi:hypothetical protein
VGTPPATKPKKVAESREKPNAAGMMITIIGGMHAREALSGAPRYSRDLRVIECPAGVAALASENTHYRK